MTLTLSLSHSLGRGDATSPPGPLFRRAGEGQGEGRAATGHP